MLIVALHDDLSRVLSPAFDRSLALPGSEPSVRRQHISEILEHESDRVRSRTDHLLVGVHVADISRAAATLPTELGQAAGLIVTLDENGNTAKILKDRHMTWSVGQIDNRLAEPVPA